MSALATWAATVGIETLPLLWLGLSWDCRRPEERENWRRIRAAYSRYTRWYHRGQQITAAATPGKFLAEVCEDPLVTPGVAS